MIPQTNKIHQGDCREIMRPWDDECIDMSICSPPYWGLRDYKLKSLIWDGNENCEHKWEKYKHPPKGGHSHPDRPPKVGANRAEMEKGISIRFGYESNFCSLCGAWKGQLGLEPTFDLYIKHLCDIFDGIKRVLKKEGSIWVNLGDTYYNVNSNMANDGRAGFSEEQKEQFNYSIGSGKCLICGKPTNKQFCSMKCLNTMGNDFRSQNRQFPSKCLTLIPFRFVIEMINRGWILRNTIIWHKPNPMPSSAKDRFTVDFEYLFFFVKNKKYYFEQQFEELNYDSFRETKRGKNQPKAKIGDPMAASVNARESLDDWKINPQGRNMRCVWTIPTMPCSEAHFAVFPEKLLMAPIKAGCPEFICKKCGKARMKIYEYSGGTIGKSWHSHKEDIVRGQRVENEQIKKIGDGSYKTIFRGYTDCNCHAGFEGGIVLDPFAGCGTTGIVAQKLGRRYILIDLSPEYVKLAKRNLSQGWLV